GALRIKPCAYRTDLDEITAQLKAKPDSRIPDCEIIPTRPELTGLGLNRWVAILDSGVMEKGHVGWWAQADPIPEIWESQCLNESHLLAYQRHRRLESRAGRIVPSRRPPRRHPAFTVKCWYDGMVKCWYDGMVKCWYDGMVKCWYDGMVRCWYDGMVRYWYAKVKCWYDGMVKCWYDGMVRCWYDGMVRYWYAKVKCWYDGMVTCWYDVLLS
ncbi:hypothetical protein NFI96_020960, partial [Prochilodus magdalenae]